MECDAARLLFARYTENQLTEVQRRVLDDHVEGCESCSQEVERFNKVFELVGDYFQIVKPSDGFLDSVMVGVEGAAERGKNRLTAPRKAVSSEKKGGNKILLVGVMAILALVAGYFVLRRDSSAGEIVQVARVAQRQKTDKDAWSSIAANARIFAGDTVRAEGGLVRLRLVDQSEIVLNDAASLTVAKPMDDGGTSHVLVGGVARFAVWDSRSGFEVAIPGATIEVVAGEEEQSGNETRFAVAVPSDDRSSLSHVDVTKGKVRVTNPHGSTIVDAGMRCNVRQNAAPSKPIKPNRESGRSREKPTVAKSSERPTRTPQRAATNTSQTKPEVARVSFKDLVAQIQDSSRSESELLAALAQLAGMVGEEKEEGRSVFVDVMRREPKEKVRLAALEQLVNLNLESLSYDVLDAFQNDASLLVRRKAMEWIAGGADKEEARQQLVSALGDLLDEDLAPLKIDIVKEVAKFGNPDDIRALLDQLQIGLEDPSLNEAVLEAVGNFKAVEAVDALLEFLRDSDETVRRSAVQSLRKLTGQSFGYDPQVEEPSLREDAVIRWEDWWSEHRNGFEF